MRKEIAMTRWFVHAVDPEDSVADAEKGPLRYWFAKASSPLAYRWVPSLRRWLMYEDALASGRAFTTHAYASTRRQAERIASRMPDPAWAVLTLRSSRVSRKFPRGYERSFGATRSEKAP